MSVLMSLCYVSPSCYHWLMRRIYGRRAHEERYRKLAAWIPKSASVLDVCCGDGALATFLPLSTHYTGFDNTPSMVKAAQQRGLRVACLTLHPGLRGIGVADYVILQGALYHFLPDPLPVLDWLAAHAKVGVLLTEPMDKWTTPRFRRESFRALMVRWGGVQVEECGKQELLAWRPTTLSERIT